jgi:hypothetical protein
MKHADPEIHALTTAEIARQIRLHSDRRMQIVNERAAMYATALKNGGASESPVIDDDEKAARQHAKSLLNGSAPASLSVVESGITLDKILYREQRGIDIALKILTDKDLVARAADAVAWAEANSDQWRALCREIVLTTIRLDALEHSARELIGQCGDVFSVRLPMGNIVGGRSISETPIGELTEIALAEGVVTSADIRKAKNVS